MTMGSLPATEAEHLSYAQTVAAANVRNLQATAKRHGTFNSPTDGTIMYVDPDHEDERHHSPLMTEAEARVAFERGLIEDPKDAKRVKLETVMVETDPNLIGKVAAERTAQFAEQDDAGGPGSGTLDSRSSTAWPDRGRVEGGAQGPVSGQRAQTGTGLPSDIDQDSGDDDAPPARRGGRTAGGKS